MVPRGEQAGGLEPRDPPAVERAVLRALCLTVNVAGSAVKDRILDTLTKEHFSLPITKAVFAALGTLHQKGEYVVLSNLKDELHALAMEVPSDFSLEDLFRGEPPKPAEVKAWVEDLRDPAVRLKAARGAADAAAELPGPGREGGPARPRAVSEVRRSAPDPERSPTAGPPREEAAGARPRPSASAPLSSEGEEWATYLQEVAAKQGKTFETGFAGLDKTSGGLFVGVMLVADQDSDRLSGFLKQLADQIAARAKVPCLYLSFALPKAALRLRTLSRLSGVPARHLEKGRLRKGSPEWESVERNGQAAAEWLKWIFVVDGDPEVSADQVLEMGRQLLDTHGAPTCLLVVDGLDKLRKAGESPQALVGWLKRLSESLDALVIAASADRALSAASGVDLVAALGEEGGAVKLELLRADDPRPSILRFEYRREIHRFVEQPAS